MAPFADGGAAVDGAPARARRRWWRRSTAAHLLRRGSTRSPTSSSRGCRGSSTHLDDRRRRAVADLKLRSTPSGSRSRAATPRASRAAAPAEPARDRSMASEPAAAATAPCGAGPGAALAKPSRDAQDRACPGGFNTSDTSIASATRPGARPGKLLEGHQRRLMSTRSPGRRRARPPCRAAPRASPVAAPECWRRPRVHRHDFVRDVVVVTLGATAGVRRLLRSLPCTPTP